MQTVAVGWQVFSVSGDPLDLGLVALSQFLPFVLLILPAGHVADQYDRRRVQLITYLLLLACAVALLTMTVSGVTATRVSPGAVSSGTPISMVQASSLGPARNHG